MFVSNQALCERNSASNSVEKSHISRTLHMFILGIKIEILVKKKKRQDLLINPAFFSLN